MIGGTVHQQRLTSKFVDGPSQIAKNLLPNFGFEPRPAVLSAEERVNQNVGIGVGHGGTPLTSGRTSPAKAGWKILFRVQFPRLAPWARGRRPRRGLRVADARPARLSGRTSPASRAGRYFSRPIPAACAVGQRTPPASRAESSGSVASDA